MTTQPSEASSRLLARLTGLFLVIMAIAAGFAEFGVRAALVVPGDPAATAQNILGSEQRFRFGFLGYLLAFLCDVPVAILFYVLLAPVNRTLALIAAAFRLVYTSIVGASLLNYFGALVILTGGTSFAAFVPGELPSLALLFLTLFDHGFTLALAFFGVHLVLLGILLVRSSRFPRIFGWLIGAGGAAYLVDSLTTFVAPGVNATVAPYLAALAMAEAVFAIWLLIKGVKHGPSLPT